MFSKALASFNVVVACRGGNRSILLVIVCSNITTGDETTPDKITYSFQDTIEHVHLVVSNACDNRVT